MKADLERKVHELLDAGRDPADDPEIRSAMADDDETRAEVAGLTKLEGWLRDWEVNVPDEDFEPIALRIEQRLDEPLGSFDATAVPEFDDPDAKVSSLGGERGAVRSGEYSLDALAGAVDAPSPVAMTGPSPAVALPAPPRAEPKRRGPIAPWLAAAAVVALGVTVSVATLNRADEPMAAEMAAPQAEQAPGAYPASPTTSAEPAPPEEPMEMAEAEEAPAMEEEATAELDDEAGANTVTETATVGGASPDPSARRRTSRGSTMATAMTTATARGASPFDTASGGGGGPPMAVQAEGAGESERRAAVERSKAGVRACLGSGADSAVVMVRFRDGAVRDARLVRPAGNASVNQCVAAALRRARIRPEGQQSRTLHFSWGGVENAYR